MTYADVLKNQSGYLNPGMEPTPLIPKAPRVHLSDEAKAKLREVIKEEQNPDLKPHVELKKEGVSRVERVKKLPSKPTIITQPITLATASDWVVPGSVIGDSIIASGVKSSFAAVRLLKSNQRL